MYLHLLALQGVEGQKKLRLAPCKGGRQVQAGPAPVGPPAGFPRGGSHNDQAGETRGLEGGTKPVKGLSASERVVATS